MRRPILDFVKLLLAFALFPALVVRQALRTRRFRQLEAAAKRDRDRVVLEPATDPDHCWTSPLPSDRFLGAFGASGRARSCEVWLDGIRVAPSDLVAVHVWEHGSATMASGFEEDAVYRFTVRRNDGAQTQEIAFLLASTDRTLWPLLSAIPQGASGGVAKEPVRSSESLGHSYGIGLLLLIPWVALASLLTLAALLWFGHKGRW